MPKYATYPILDFLLTETKVLSGITGLLPDDHGDNDLNATLYYTHLEDGYAVDWYPVTA